jgi:hypothetical protein
MSTELTITLPDDIYRQFENVAEASEQDVADVVAELVVSNAPKFEAHSRRTEMEQEEAAFIAMHPELWLKYPQEYVAVYQGKMVDHDPDVISLARRVRKSHPGEVVLITQVQRQATRDLYFRSPRFVKNV